HEINGDNAAQIAQTDLTRGLVRRGDVEIEREAFGIAAALARAGVDINGDERGDGVDGEHAAAGDWRGAGERVFDCRVQLGADLRIRRRFGEQEFAVAIVLGDAVRIFAVVAGLGEFNDRIFAPRGFACDGNNNALALAQIHALLAHAGAAIIAERQESLLIAEPKIEEGAPAALVDLAHTGAVKLAPTGAPAFVACPSDAQRDRLAVADQRFAGFADGGVEPGFERLAHERADSMRFAVS